MPSINSAQVENIICAAWSASDDLIKLDNGIDLQTGYDFGEKSPQGGFNAVSMIGRANASFVEALCDTGSGAAVDRVNENIQIQANALLQVLFAKLRPLGFFGDSITDDDFLPLVVEFANAKCVAFEVNGELTEDTVRSLIFDASLFLNMVTIWGGEDFDSSVARFSTGGFEEWPQFGFSLSSLIGSIVVVSHYIFLNKKDFSAN